MPPLCGLVLAGGHSRRMGHPKALINYHGLPQAAHAYNVLKDSIPQCFLSMRNNQFSHSSLKNIPKIIDQGNHQGPLSGILSAMAEYPKTSWLVIACDMPLINKFTIEMLINQRATKMLGTAFSIGDKPQPMCAIYEARTQKILKSIYLRGQGPSQLFKSAEAKLITLNDPSSLTNANDPKDYDKIIKTITARASDSAPS